MPRRRQISRSSRDPRATADAAFQYASALQDKFTKGLASIRDWSHISHNWRILADMIEETAQAWDVAADAFEEAGIRVDMRNAVPPGEHAQRLRAIEYIVDKTYRRAGSFGTVYRRRPMSMWNLIEELEGYEGWMYGLRPGRNPSEATIRLHDDRADEYGRINATDYTYRIFGSEAAIGRLRNVFKDREERGRRPRL